MRRADTDAGAIAYLRLFVENIDYIEARRQGARVGGPENMRESRVQLRVVRQTFAVRDARAAIGGRLAGR